MTKISAVYDENGRRIDNLFPAPQVRMCPKQWQIAFRKALKEASTA